MPSPLARGKVTRALVLAATAIAMLAGSSPASATPPRPVPITPPYGASHQPAANKATVLYFFDQLFNRGNLAVIDKLVQPDYIQHNPTLPSGAHALRDWVAGLKTVYPQSQVTTWRAIAEGDLVILHSNFVLEPGTKGTAAFDIFRLENGTIAEHWDVLQQVPDTTASGNDMFSTISTPRLPWPDPRASAAASKRIALALFTGLTVHKDLTAYDRYAAASYYQHNPQVANGIAGSKEFFSAILSSSPDFTVSIKRVIAEGDLVAIHSHFKATPDDRGLAIVDLLRIRDGKVVEHWDVIQPVPATSANDNTMF